MSIVQAKILPPPPQASDWLVTVWVREHGVVVPHRVATDASDEVTAQRSALQHLRLNRPRAGQQVVDIRIRRRG